MHQCSFTHDVGPDRSNWKIAHPKWKDRVESFILNSCQPCPNLDVKKHIDANGMQIFSHWGSCEDAVNDRGFQCISAPRFERKNTWGELLKMFEEANPDVRY